MRYPKEPSEVLKENNLFCARTSRSELHLEKGGKRMHTPASCPPVLLSYSHCRAAEEFETGVLVCLAL